MLNAPVTGDPDVDSFLYDLQNQQSTSTGVVANTSTGAISDSNTGVIIGYLYKYMHVKYALDNIGTGMSTSDTGMLYYGIQNTDSTTASTAPADYTWFLTVGFGTTYNLYYVTNGGRQIQWAVDTVTPAGYTVAPSMIDLDVVSGAPAGISATVAYKIQSQAIAAPSFSTPTVGNAVPAGWTATLGTPTVGQVVWYLFGRYNSADVTVDGIAANTTEWGGLTAASVFQDIRSDNWNGSNPPTFTTPATWGTTGYYIRRDDGTIIANNLGARGTLQAGTAARSGTAMTGTGANLQNDGTFAIGKSSAYIVGDGTNIYIRGFINDIYSGGIWSGYSGAAVSSYSETNTSSTRVIDSGKYTCSLSGGVSVNGTYAAYRRLYVSAQFVVNINGSDTLSGQTGIMIPVANSGSAYDTTIPVNLTKQFDMSPYTGQNAYLKTILLVQTMDIVSNTSGYTEINAVYTGNVALDIREFNL